jgi:poly-beta-1,6 N-acetyl-D-glucosamine synthase
MSRASTRRRPVEHWWTLGVVTLVALSALLLHGFASSEVGHASTQSNDRSGEVPAMATAGPVLDLSGTSVRSVSVPRQTVALTFDDGPDGRWTPAILAVLARYHVPATFFVIGSHAVNHGGLLRREVGAGDQVGNHTFTHVDLTYEPQWRVRLELRLTQAAIAAATGRHTILVRPPYSSEPSAAGADTVAAWQRIAHQGYLVTVSTLDTEDWRPTTTVDDIVARATPEGTSGAVVLMHDGGGNRAKTVTALERLIPALQARGDRFVTIGGLAGLSNDTVMPPVSTTARWQSMMITSAFWTSGKLVNAFALLAVVMVVLLLGRLLLVLVFAPRHRRRLVPFDSAFTPTVTVLVPAYNEELGIAATLHSLCHQTYEHYDIMVIDDGSTDNTVGVIQAVIKDDDANGRVRLIQQPNAGKANALNHGLRVATGEIIVTVDADTVFEPNALATLIQPLHADEVGAVSGNTKVGNRTRLLGRWQHLEYVMGFNLDRRMYDVLGCIPTVPGAIGAFRTSALDAVNGFSEDTLAEDTDLTMALQRAGHQVTYEPRAIAWTEAPHGLRDLWRQRYRWSYGTMQSTWKHRGAITERPATRLGRVGIPYLVVFQIVLPVLGPLVDLFALYGILFLDRKLIIAYWLTFTFLQVAICAYALQLDHEPLGDVWTLPLQQVVYRQLMYLVVIQSVSTALTGAHTHWHKLHRRGTFNQPQTTADA